MGRKKRALLAYRADSAEPSPGGASPDQCTRVEVGRFDGAKVVTTSQGYLRVPAYPTRTGVLEYRKADGTVRREYRPADEVFKADSLASLEDAPVTDLHPAGLVSTESHTALAKGHARDIRQDGKFVAATVLIQDAALVAAVKSGSRKELSCGYVCKLDSTPGVSPEGEHYDAIQRDIRYNHVALLPPGAGRAGSDVSLRLDSATGVHVTPEAPPQIKEIMPIKLDGKEYTYGSKEHVEALEAKHAAELATARKDAADRTVERDAARADAADAKDPAKQAARVQARVALETSARTLLGDETKFDGKTDEEVRLAVIAKAFPELKFEGMTPEVKAVHVTARFDAALAFTPSTETTASGTARGALLQSTTAGETGAAFAQPMPWTPPKLAMSR